MLFCRKTKNQGIANLAAMIAVFSFVFSGCTSFKGEYSDPNAVEIVDDRWNETDARVTSEKMIGAMLSKYWLKAYKERNAGKRPLVIVGDVENRTDEHIDVKALSDYVSDELINSGRVRFVDAANRERILKEINYQNESGMVNEKTAKRKGRQVGADFLLFGTLSSSVHKHEGLKTVTYQTNLRLTDLETAEIVWSSKHLIKKRFKKSGSSW
jgi:uncharacterized protein (TIGR02722 family)